MYKIKNNLSVYETYCYIRPKTKQDMGNFKCTHSNIRHGNGIFAQPENLGNCPRHD